MTNQHFENPTSFAGQEYSNKISGMLITALCVILILPSVGFCEDIKLGDFPNVKAGGIAEPRHISINMTSSFELHVILDMTAKGNGTLELPDQGLLLRVYDTYDDGIVFEGGMLKVSFVDLEGSGVKNLIISGVAVLTGEKENSPHANAPMVQVYRFDPEMKKLNLCYSRGSDFITIRSPLLDRIEHSPSYHKFQAIDKTLVLQVDSRGSNFTELELGNHTPVDFSDTCTLRVFDHGVIQRREINQVSGDAWVQEYDPH
jgi:hypothetical protein